MGELVVDGECVVVSVGVCVEEPVVEAELVWEGVME